MKYWLYSAGDIKGPFEVSELLSSGAFGSESLVCPETRSGENAADWNPAASVGEISQALAARPGGATAVAAGQPAAAPSESDEISGWLKSMGFSDEELYEAEKYLGATGGARKAGRKNVFRRDRVIKKLSEENASGRLSELESGMRETEARLKNQLEEISRLKSAAGGETPRWAEQDAGLKLPRSLGPLEPAWLKALELNDIMQELAFDSSNFISSEDEDDLLEFEEAAAASAEAASIEVIPSLEPETGREPLAPVIDSEPAAASEKPRPALQPFAQSEQPAAAAEAAAKPEQAEPAVRLRSEPLISFGDTAHDSGPGVSILDSSTRQPEPEPKPEPKPEAKPEAAALPELKIEKPEEPVQYDAFTPRGGAEPEFFTAPAFNFEAKTDLPLTIEPISSAFSQSPAPVKENAVSPAAATEAQDVLQKAVPPAGQPAPGQQVRPESGPEPKHEQAPGLSAPDVKEPPPAESKSQPAPAAQPPSSAAPLGKDTTGGLSTTRIMGMQDPFTTVRSLADSVVTQNPQTLRATVNVLEKATLSKQTQHVAAALKSAKLTGYAEQPPAKSRPNYKILIAAVIGCFLAIAAGGIYFFIKDDLEHLSARGKGKSAPKQAASAKTDVSTASLKEDDILASAVAESTPSSRTQPAAIGKSMQEPAQPFSGGMMSPAINKAVEIVKQYSLGGGRGTIAQWFYNSFVSGSGSAFQEEWSATQLHGSDYVVQYRLLRPRADAIVYQFGVNVEQGKVTRGINNSALELLGTVKPEQPAMRVVSKQKITRQPKKRKISSQLELPPEPKRKKRSFADMLGEE